MCGKEKILFKSYICGGAEFPMMEVSVKKMFIMAFVTFKSDLVKLVIFHFDLVATPRSNRTKNNSTKRKLLLKLA